MVSILSLRKPFLPSDKYYSLIFHSQDFHLPGAELMS